MPVSILFPPLALLKVNYINSLITVSETHICRDRETEVFHLLVRFPYGCDGPDWARPKLGCRSFFHVSGAGAQVLGTCSAAFPDTLLGSYVENGAARTWTDTHVGYWGCRQWLNLPHRNAGPLCVVLKRKYLVALLFLPPCEIKSPLACMIRISVT